MLFEHLLSFHQCFFFFCITSLGHHRMVLVAVFGLVKFSTEGLLLPEVRTTNCLDKKF